MSKSARGKGIYMSRGDMIPVSERRQGKFHRPAMGMVPKDNMSYGNQEPVPEILNKPLRAHKVGENGGDIVLRTEKESRVILISDEEVTVYKKTGQPTVLTIFLTVVILIEGALLVYLAI